MKLHTTEYRIDAGAGVVFAFVSDLHDAQNQPILDTIAALSPDAVLVGGDFIHNNAVCERGFAFLQASAARWPTFCSVGNHERSYQGDLSAQVSATGAMLLDNDAQSFRGIWLGGLSSGFLYGGSQGNRRRTPAPDLEWAREFSRLAGYKLLLCHHPEYYERYLRALPIDLILSGHAHGGQWRIGGQGVFAPGQGLFPRYTCGRYDGRLIVSRGIGNRAPVPRLFNPPEVVILRL